MTDRFGWDRGEVSADWHHPPSGSDVLVLTHGAGGTKDTPSLRAYADAVAARGLGAVRFNLPYAEAGRRSPGSAAPNEACWRAVAEAVRPRAARLFLGGRSYGGRLASNIVAEGTPCAGLVFIAYPLHPPGRPENIRDAHLRRITAPMLFLQGSADPFADPALLDATIASLPTATLHRLEGGDHSHRVRGRSEADVIAELADATMRWLASTG